jgi:hypothetical protein
MTPRTPAPGESQSAELLPDGSWRLEPLGQTIALPGEWWTFVSLFTLGFFDTRIVYGRVKNSPTMVAIHVNKMPKGTDPITLCPFPAAELRIRGMRDDAGKITVQIVSGNGAPGAPAELRRHR